jgi:hypothetical protein
MHRGSRNPRNLNLFRVSESFQSPKTILPNFLFLNFVWIAFIFAVSFEFAPLTGIRNAHHQPVLHALTSTIHLSIQFFCFHLPGFAINTQFTALHSLKPHSCSACFLFFTTLFLSILCFPTLFLLILWLKSRVFSQWGTSSCSLWHWMSVLSWGLCTRGNRALFASVLILRKAKLPRGRVCPRLLLLPLPRPLLLGLRLKMAWRELSISTSKFKSVFVFSLIYLPPSMWCSLLLRRGKKNRS